MFFRCPSAFQLDTLCACLGIPLNHHEAGSDSQACAQLFIDYVNCGADPARFLRRYDLTHGCTLRRPKKR